MTKHQPAGRDEVEVAHEALIRHWPRLRQWLDQDRAALLLRESIREASQEWERHERDESYLAHRGRRLAQAEALAQHPRFTLNAQERSYLDAAVALREREEQEREAQQQRELAAQQERAELAEVARHEAEQRVAEQAVAAGRLRRRFLVAAGLGVLAVLAAIYAFYNFQEAGQQRVVAEEQRAVAIDAQIRAEAEAARAATEATRADEQAANAQIRALAAHAQLQRDLGQDERAALLAVEAYAVSERAGGAQQGFALSALNDSVDTPFFSSLIGTDLGGISSLAFSTDGAKLAAGGFDGRVQLWDMLSSPPTPLPTFSVTEGRVWAVEFDPTGSALVTGGDKGDLKWWDLRNLRVQGEIQPSSVDMLDSSGMAVRDIAFSPDGDYVAAAGYDGFVRLWRVEGFLDPDFSQMRTLCPESDTEPLNSVCLSSGRVLSLAFNRDGSFLAASGNDGVVRIWNMDDSQAEPQVLPKQPGAILAVSFDPTSNLLAIASENLSIELWDLKTKNRPCAILHGHDEKVRNLAFTRNGSTLASGSEDETIRLWDLERLTSKNETIRLGNVETHGIDCKSPEAPYNLGSLAVLGGSEEHIWALAVSPNDQTLASASGGGNMRLWDLGELGSGKRVLKGHASWVHSLAFDPGQGVDDISCGPLLASGSDDGAVHIWRGGEFEELKSPDGRAIRAVAFAPPEGTWLAAAGHAGVVYLWNLGHPCEMEDHPDPRELKPGSNEPGYLIALAFSPDGTRLAAAAQDGSILVWDLSLNDPSQWHQPDYVLGKAEEESTNDPTSCVPNQRPPTTQMWSVAFAPDGQTIAGGDSDGDIHIFDLNNPGTESLLTGHAGGIPSLDFSQNGARLASASCDNTVRLWDTRFVEFGGAAPTDPERILRGHESAVRSLAFSPDDKLLATGSHDQTVRLWNLERPEDDPAVLGRQEEWVRAVAFKPDGTTLAASSADAAIRLWAVQAADLVEHACNTVGRDLTPDEWAQFIGSDYPYQPACPQVMSDNTAGPGQGDKPNIVTAQ